MSIQSETFYSVDHLYDFIKERYKRYPAANSKESWDDRMRKVVENTKKFMQFYQEAEIEVRMPRVKRDIVIMGNSLQYNWTVRSAAFPGYFVTPSIVLKHAGMGIVKSVKPFVASGKHNEFHNIFRGFLEPHDHINFGKRILNTCEYINKERVTNIFYAVREERTRITNNFQSYVEAHQKSRSLVDQKRAKNILLDALNRHKIEASDYTHVDGFLRVILNNDFGNAELLLNVIKTNATRMKLLKSEDVQDACNRIVVRKVMGN